jgi:hypothetical protein
MLIWLQKTAAIVALAVCLVGPFGIALWESSHSPNSPQQLSDHKATSEPSNKADEEKPEAAIARYTYWLTWVTFILAVATIGLGGIGMFQINLARAEFISTHRPRLRIRNVVVREPQDAYGKKWPRFHPGQIVRGQFFIANVGSGRADILEGHCSVYWTNDGLPMARPYEGKRDNLAVVSNTLLSGESTHVLFQSETLVGQEGPTFGMRTILGHNLYVMGWVTYADGNGNVRRTAFCREYFKNKGPNGEIVGTGGRFFPVDNPDYEHEE